jgi:hypothetical protein
MKDSTVKDLEALHQKAKRARSRLEPVWFMNLAYTQGQQWLAWDGQGLYKPAMKRSRVTLVDNRILPCVRTAIAKMTKNRPIFTVTPRTADEQDAHASELGEQLLLYLWKHLDLYAVTSNALEWSQICGAGFLKVFWDPTLGEGCDVVVGPQGDVLTDGMGKAIPADSVDPQQMSESLGVPVTIRSINQGDIRVEARSPFQVYPDPLVDTFSEAEWLIEESVKSVEQVRRRYGVTLDADTNANPGLVESRMATAYPSGTSGYKGVRICEYWCKPNVDHPNGRRAVWSKNKLLAEDEHPFDCMPYVMLSAISMPGRLWPTSIVEQLRGPQTELNKVKSQIAENRNRIGNPTILASKQAVQDPDKFAASTSTPGGIYYYDDLGSPNTIPTYLQGPPLPQYVIDEIQRIEESIQEISGQHEVSSANVPPGVTAASAINLLMEADDTRMGPIITDFENQLGALGQKVLKLAARYYTDARTIRIGGDDGVWQIFDFRGAMLRDNTHVEVQAGSAFPQSKAAKQAAMQDLLTFFVQSGNPPHGKQLAQFLKDWEIGGADKLIEDYTADESQANRENVRIQQGIPININDYDNDPAHVDAHQDAQKQQSYELWPPQSKMIMEAHVAAHKQRIAQNQQAQMQQQLQMQGQAPDGSQLPPQQNGNGGDPNQQLQMQLQAAQAQHQIAASSAQQGQQMAATGDSARQAEELHQQRLRHAEEQHRADLVAKARAQQQRGR